MGKKAEELYTKRFERHFDELRWLYMELYDNGSMFAELCGRMKEFYEERNEALKNWTAGVRSSRTGTRRTICSA